MSRDKRLPPQQTRSERAGIQPTLQPQGLPESGDLHATLRISQQEARRGTSRAIRLPGGRQTSVVVPAGAYEGQVIALEGLGEPAFPAFTSRFFEEGGEVAQNGQKKT